MQMTGENSHLPCQLAIQAPNLVAFQVRFISFLMGFVGFGLYLVVFCDTSGVIWPFKGIWLILDDICILVTFSGSICLSVFDIHHLYYPTRATQCSMQNQNL